MKPIYYGILSTSSIAPRFIAAVRAAQAGEVIAVSSRSLEKAQQKAQQWQIATAYGSHKELLEDPRINVVYISAVNAQHYPLAKMALEYGKHVVCEKPCTTSAADTKDLFRLAKEKNLFLMEAEKMLFLPAVLAVRDRIDKGDLGKIQMVELSHSFSPSYNGWMFDPQAGGGKLLSSGIYAVQLLIWLFGPIAQIRGIPGRLPNGAEDQYVLMGQTESGVLFHIKNSTRTALDNTAKFYGEKGWAELPEYWKARKAIFCITGGELQTEEFPCEHELMYEASHVRDCLQANLRTSPVVTPELTVAGIEALEQVKNHW